MKKEVKNGLRQHNNWVAACLDILGQTEAMEKIDFVKSQMSDEERARFDEGVRKVYYSTQLLHDSIEEWVANSKKTPPPFQNMSDKEKKIWEITNGRPLKWQRFSDGLIVYSSLADPSESSPMRPIYFIIGGCAAAMLRMLAYGTPIRGGIAMGAASELKPNELYGPVLATAHKLESKVADYPSIVVDNRLYEHLVRIRNSEGGGIRGDSDRAIAAACLELISIDMDGNAIVDYLGENFRAHTGLVKTDPMFNKIDKFIESEYDKYRAVRNTKLAFRYALLFNYFAVRIKEQ